MTLKTKIVLAASIASFFTAFMGASLSVAVSAIAREFAVRPDDITAAVAAYVITASAFLVPATGIANRLGYTKTFTVGLCLSGVMTLIVSLSSNLFLMVAARALQGISSAIVFCSSYAVMSYYIAPKERSTAIGINTASVYLGLSLSPCLGGFITDYLGWQTLFYVSAAGFFCAFLLLRKVPLDTPNTTFCPYLKMLMVFISIMTVLCSSAHLTESLIYSLATLGGLMLLGYYLYLEVHSSHPLLPVRVLISNGTLSYELVGAFFNYMSIFAITLMLSLYFQEILHYSASFTGLLLMIQPILQCLVSPCCGMWCNRVNPHLLVFTGMLLSTLATTLFIFISPDLSLYLIVLGQIMAGLGAGIFSTPNTVIIMGSVDHKEYALASGLLAFARNCGMAFCMSIFTAVLIRSIQVDSGHPDYAAELNSALSISFTLSTLFGVLGMLCCLKSTQSARRAQALGEPH